MRRAFIAALCVMLLTGLSSCVKDVIMDAKEKPEVAVACILSDDPVQELHIVYTKGASVENAPKVMEAVAVLKDLTTGETKSFERQEDGVWRMDYAAVPEHRYRIEVSVPGYDTLIAEDTMPDSVRVYLQHRYWLAFYVQSPNGYLEVPSPTGDLVLAGGPWWEDGEDLPRGETFFGVLSLNDPVWIFAMNYNPITGEREIVDNICTDYSEADQFNITGGIYTPPQWEERIPYPIWPLYEELLKDTHVKALYPWLEGSPMHNSYIRIAPRDLGGYPLGFGISGSFNGKFNCPDNFMDFRFHHGNHGFVRNLAEDEGYVVWTAVSNQLDKYLKEAFHFMGINTSTDLTTIYLRDNFYANIKDSNGLPQLGVFGCKIERQFQWSSEGTFIDYDRSRESSSFQEAVRDYFYP